jgi:hypothetical protein
MDVQDLIVNFRKQVSDLEPPYLWDDDEALLYVIDAQDKFVRVMGGISDNGSTRAGTAISDIPVVAGQAMASFSPYILRLRTAKLLTAQRMIDIIDEAQLQQLSHYHDYGLQSAAYLRDDDTGSVKYAIIGLEDNKLRWYKVPTVADTCRLHCYRLPYPRLTSQEGALEIDEQHHIHLLKWMKYHAYSKEDAETYDKDLADKNEAAFVKYCETARAEKDRQRFKVRAVQSNPDY